MALKEILFISTILMVWIDGIGQTGFQSPDYQMDGTEPVQALEVRQGAMNYASCEFKDSIYHLTMNPTNGAPVEGMLVHFKAAETNPKGVSVMLGGFGPFQIVRHGFIPLEANQIIKNQMVQLIFNGRSFEMLNPVAPDVFNRSDEPRIIFVSSDVYSSDLGGLEGADQICTELALAAGLDGEWMALLSTSEVHARDRTVHTGTYINTAGSVVSFNGFQDAWDGQEPSAIYKSVRYNEFGERLGDEDTNHPLPVWTGSGYDGRYVDFPTCKGKGSSCKDWTWTGEEEDCCCNDSSCEGSGIYCGIFGNASSNEGYWIYSRNSGCKGEKHLYCIQR